MPRKFLLVVDDTPEFRAAMLYASRRARSTGGRVALLRVIRPGSDAHWSGARDEILRQQREEAEALLARVGAEVEALSGAQPVFLIEESEPEQAIRKSIAEDPDIKILVLGVGERSPGPLISAMVRKGAAFTGRKMPVTMVPGELTLAEIEDLA